MRSKFIFIIIVSFHLYLLINIRFTAWPEMFSYPYLYNNGFILYKDFIHPYPPLLTLVLGALYKNFGLTELTLKAFTWLLFIINDLFIYLIAKKLTKNEIAAIGSLLTYILLQPFLEGNMLWFDTAIVTPLLCGIYYSLKIEKRENVHEILLASFFFTIAILIKQTAGLFALVFAILLIHKRVGIKGILIACLPPLVLFLGLLARLLREENFFDFFSWTLIYPFTFWSSFPGYVQMSMKGRDLAVTLTLLMMPILGYFTLGKQIKRRFIYIVLFLLVSLIAVYPRFSFFHFQSALAIACITLSPVFLNKKRGFVVFTLIFMFLYTKVHKPSIIFEWGKETRFAEESDRRLADLISSNIPKKERVFLLGVHSNIYAYSDRLPVKPWTDNFGWYLEIPGIQEKIISQWEEQDLKFIVWRTPKNGNWYDLAVYQPEVITKWIKENYEETATIQEDLTLWQRKN